MLLLALALCPVPVARADHIDADLLFQAKDVLRHVQDKGYKNVGVLHFVLQKGDHKPTYAAGMINANMAARLETALVMQNDPNNPVGIIHDASKVAAEKAPRSHWSAADARLRAALFDHDYPLAWGNKTVKADAFLTGNVRLSADMQTTTLRILCFDKKANKLEEVTKFDVKTDRDILAEAGQSFVLSRSLVKKRSLEAKDKEDLDDLMDTDAAKSAKDRDENKGGAANAKGGNLANEYVEFEVWYDEERQAPAADANEGGEARITPPRPGQKVTFSFKNKTGEDIGLVMFVNGKSTLEYMTDAPEMCRRWVLPADGKTYWIRGYLDENDVLKPFKIASKDDETVKNELADKLGLIEVFVFLKGEGKVPPKETTEEMLVSRGLNLRGLSPHYTKRLGIKGKPETPAEARTRAFQTRGLKPTEFRKVRKRGDGGFIVPDPELTKQLTIETRGLPNPTLVSAPIVIRYNDRPAD
jgi:hypothetical protein